LVGLELLLHGFYVHGLFHDYEVVWDVVGEDRLDEWPRGFVLLHGFDDVLALDLEAALFSLFELLVIGPAPASFKDSWYELWVDRKLFFNSFRRGLYERSL
jgi:hypothetical protein